VEENGRRAVRKTDPQTLACLDTLSAVRIYQVASGTSNYEGGTPGLVFKADKLGVSARILVLTPC